MPFTPPAINDKPIDHITSRGVTFRCARADLREPIIIYNYDHITSFGEFAKAAAEFAAWHALCIFDQLNGFQGYGSLDFKLSEEVE
jgi:hypothetical protein